MAFSNFLSGIQNLWKGTYDNYNDFIIPNILNGNGILFDLSQADQVSTVYTCLKILADTLARLPLNVYTDKGEGRTVDKIDYRYPILHYNPNNWTSQQTFFSALEYWRNLRGNSFAKIYRDNSGKVTSLILIPPSKVKSYGIVNSELYYTITNDNNVDEVINASEILHFKGLTKDGVWGLNPIEALRLNVSSTYQGLNTIDNFYKNNALSPKAIKSTISGANQKSMLEALEEFKRKYTGSTNAGQMIPLPPNTEIMDMALNFVDAEFISTLKFNTTQISALYGVPAWMVGILEATKWNNVELMMDEFKATTLSAITRMYRQELEFKLLSISERINGVSIEFNMQALVEADITTRSTYFKTLSSMGVITPNDICIKEGFATYPEGNKHYIPGNYLTVEQIGNKSNVNISNSSTN